MTRFDSILLTFLLACPTACGDDVGGGGDDTDATGVDEEDPGRMIPGDVSIAGTLVWLDGTETDVELSANYQRLDASEAVQHSCSGTDLAEGYSLGVTWRDETPIGSNTVSPFDGPTIVVAWPQVDGDGIRATTPLQGSIEFTTIGTAPGEVVSGTAEARLMPEPDDPDDRVREVIDIAFRCVVTE